MAGERVTFADVLRIREFRVLWLADAQSAIGDQIARVALSVLVFQRTSSALLTALAYALTFVPAMLGGVLLSGLADRLPRRQVMVGCDVARAVLVGCMAIPAVPLWLLCGLLVLAVLTEAPFMAAESSLIPVILDGEQYVVGTGLRSITNQLAQLAGFAGGGVVIALIGARAGLALDAATFALSAVLIMLAVKARPAAAPEVPDSAGGRGLLTGLTSGLRLIFTTPTLRTLLGLSWLAGLFVVPEGVAAPYASALGGGPVAVGLLMAATPAGTAVGTYLWVRFVPAAARSRWMALLAAAVGVPLGLCGLHPDLAVSLVLWTVAGFFFGYQVQVITEFVRTVPDQQRGQAIGIASSGLLAVQGFGILLGGVVAGAWDVNGAVASAGLLGTVLALVLALAWRRVTAPQPAAEPAHPQLHVPAADQDLDQAAHRPSDRPRAGRHAAEPPSAGRHAAQDPVVGDRSSA